MKSGKVQSPTTGEDLWSLRKNSQETWKTIQLPSGFPKYYKVPVWSGASENTYDVGYRRKPEQINGAFHI